MIKKVLYQLVWLVMATQLYAITAKGQSLAVSMYDKKAVSPAKQSQHTKSLQRLLAEFEEMQKVSIVYQSDLLENRNVTLGKNSDYASITTLSDLLKQHNLQLRQIRRDLLMVEEVGMSDAKSLELAERLLAEKAKQQALFFIRVKGQVTSRVDGMTIPGVNVMIKGTSTGTVTDADGNFFLEAPADAVLVFSSIGYLTKEEPVNGRETIDMVLEEDLKNLDEVVVVGYSEQRKVSMTSAVSEIKGDDLSKRTVQNIQQSLQGKIAGLTILDQGAAPGKTNMVMRIRGITTLGANEPLVIVDGIEQRLHDINPADIESVSVLKDASSTAIYGSRAANGVILITTKRAKPGKLSVAYSGYYALQRTNNNPVHMGLEEYMRLQNIAWTNSSGAPIFSEEYIQEY